LRLWRYPAFEAFRAWAAIGAKDGLFLRRIVWDQRAGGLTPALYGAEAPLEKEVFGKLLAELRGIELPPFVEVSTIGIDGVSCGIETGSYMASASLAWWGTPPAAWAPLANWHAHAMAVFEGMLPLSTPDCS
jgi:hypothetical protein